jgi:hypothetical protein
MTHRAHAKTGHLSVSWPRSFAPVPGRITRRALRSSVRETRVASFARTNGSTRTSTPRNSAEHPCRTQAGTAPEALRAVVGRPPAGSSWSARRPRITSETTIQAMPAMSPKPPVAGHLSRVALSSPRVTPGVPNRGLAAWPLMTWFRSRRWRLLPPTSGRHPSSRAPRREPHIPLPRPPSTRGR